MKSPTVVRCKLSDEILQVEFGDGFLFEFPESFLIASRLKHGRFVGTVEDSRRAGVVVELNDRSALSAATVLESLPLAS